MSTQEDTSVDVNEARRLAMEAVRFELGTYLRLEDSEFDDNELEYVFPIILRSPKLILDEDKENAVDLRFLDPIEVGEITVDAESKDIDHPTPRQVKKELEKYEEELNAAIQKALVRASGSNLSHLPFPENQYAPLQDILSEVILKGEIATDDLEMMDSYEDGEKYMKYIDSLVELDLLKRDNDVFRSGDVLNTIQDKNEFEGHELETHQDELNAALGRYFEHNVGEFDMIKRTLGPYLAIAGFYYRRALELDELPIIKEQELRDGIKLKYSGRERQKKLFKMSRYLVQLEDVGVLESVYQGGERYWAGDDNTFQRLRNTADQLGPVTELFSPSIFEQQTLGGMSD
jgi:rRNA-processing protein FCF1